MEAAVKAAAEAGGAKLQAFWANTLCHPEDLPFKLDQLPQNFGGWVGGRGWGGGWMVGGGCEAMGNTFLPWVGGLAAWLQLLAVCGGTSSLCGN